MAFEDYCALSRVYGGVHFVASIEAGRQLCRGSGISPTSSCGATSTGRPGTMISSRHVAVGGQASGSPWLHDSFLSPIGLDWHRLSRASR